MPVKVLALLLYLIVLARKSCLNPSTGLVGSGDSSGQQTTDTQNKWTPWAPLTSPDLPRTPRSVGEVFGTIQLPDALVRALQDQLRVTREGGGMLLSELRTGRGIHAFL